MSLENPLTRNSYRKNLHHFLADFFEMSFAVILLCTIQRQKTKNQRVLEDSVSKIRSSQNRSTLTKSESFLQDANLLDLDVGQLEGLALGPV